MITQKHWLISSNLSVLNCCLCVESSTHSHSLTHRQHSVNAECQIFIWDYGRQRKMFWTRFTITIITSVTGLVWNYWRTPVQDESEGLDEDETQWAPISGQSGGDRQWSAILARLQGQGGEARGLSLTMCLSSLSFGVISWTVSSGGGGTCIQLYCLLSTGIPYFAAWKWQSQYTVGLLQDIMLIK